MTKTIYIVALYTTGERWHTCVCAKPSDVVNVLTGYGISIRTAGNDESEYQQWISPTDNSQTATIMRQILIDRN